MTINTFFSYLNVLIIKRTSEVPSEIQEYSCVTILKLEQKNKESDDSQRETACRSSIKSQQSFLHRAAVHKSVFPSKLVGSWEYIVSSAELVTWCKVVNKDRVVAVLGFQNP